MGTELYMTLDKDGVRIREEGSGELKKFIPLAKAIDILMADETADAIGVTGFAAEPYTPPQPSELPARMAGREEREARPDHTDEGDTGGS